MKTKRIIGDIASLMLMVLAFDSCQKKDDLQKGEAQRDVIVTTFYAHSGENDSKTKTSRKENGDLWWSPEDEIMVFCGEASGTFVSQNKESAEIATFVGQFDKEVSTSSLSASGVLAFYPYSDDLIREEDAVVFTLPSSQPAIVGTFDDDLYPVIARSDNTELSFYNICGGAKFTVSQEGIKTVTFKGNASEPLAGKLSVTFDENGVPKVEVLEGKTEIVVTAPDDGTFEVDKEYYIVTIPQSLPKGFTIIYNDGLSINNEFKTDKAITIRRAKFGVLKYLDEDLGMINLADPIEFEDPAVEKICVDNWDTDGDGSLSYAEAAAVKSIGTVFKSNTSITSFDEFRYFTGITSIGYYAFSNCSSLTSVVIPEGVTSIGINAFYDCSSLTSVTIPSSVTYIGKYAFYNCTALKDVHISDVASWCKIRFESDNSNPLSYAKNLYLNGELVTDLIIPEGITSIRDSAFENCSSLTSVTIPSSVTSIGSYAFSDCSSLTSVVIPEGVTSIEKLTFCACSSLTSVVIPEGVTSIGSYAFSSCSSLTSVTIPSSVTSIGNDAFYNCTALKDVHISDVASWCKIRFESYKSNPFCYARNLYLNGELVTDLIIPDGVTSIGSSAFYNCSSLTSVVIPEGVTSIGSSAFYNCSSLTSVTIPSSVTLIGSSAFMNCSNLVTVYLKPTTPPTVYNSTFDSNVIYVPKESLEIYKTQWRSVSGGLSERLVGYQF